MKKIMFNDRFGLTQAVLEGRKTMTRRIVTYPLKFRGVNVAGYFVCKRPSGEVTEICMYDEDERMIDVGDFDMVGHQIGFHKHLVKKSAFLWHYRITIFV